MAKPIVLFDTDVGSSTFVAPPPWGYSVKFCCESLTEKLLLVEVSFIDDDVEEAFLKFGRADTAP